MEEIKLLGLDLSLASPEAIEVLLTDAADPAIYREILESNINRPEILKMLAEDQDVPDEIKKAVGKQLNLPARVTVKPRISDEARKDSSPPEDSAPDRG